MIWLLTITYISAISLYDMQTHRIPNWCTIPLIVTGAVLHFPGSAELWFASLFLFTAWVSHAMGAGDAKLWIGLLWMLPVEFSSQTFLLLFIAFLGTALLQITWRLLRRQRVLDTLSPAAWRAIPFLLLVWYVH